ncbi:MAG: hypothetical protein KGZ97_06660 [Bacteroidetes bacterium]|nr:hypothetical protein [Bacteroidota bacterium]
MKKLILIFVLFSIPMFISSCGEEQIILPADEFFIAFEKETYTTTKNAANPLKIPVYIAAERGAAVTVTVGINSEITTAVTGTDFEFIRGPQLNFPIGAGYDSIIIQPKTGGTPGNLLLNLFLESNSAGYKMGFFYGEQADSTSHDKCNVKINQ